jgi:hypothetical protein
MNIVYALLSVTAALAVLVTLICKARDRCTP